MRLRIGTRGSTLALAQAESVADAVRALGGDVELIPIRTEGDRLYDARLADIGGKGLFVREIDQALLGGDVDVAVHSLKDLPVDLPEGLVLAAFPPRADARDVLVTRDPCAGVAALPPGAVVGTSSLRRRALLRAARPDLDVRPIRGNVDTRLRKLGEGEYVAIVIAAAGLSRLRLSPDSARALDPEAFVPAVGQGILAVEARGSDHAVLDLLRALDDEGTHACAVAERAYLRRLGASCNTPMAGHAMLEHASLRMVAMVASDDGTRVLRDGATGSPEDAEEVGRWVAESLLAQGAAEVTALQPVL